MKSLSVSSVLSVLLVSGCGGILDLGSNEDGSTPGNTHGPDDGHPRRMFVTSSMFEGNLGGLAGADAKCDAHAQAAGLTGTYLAWLSSSQATAAERMTHHDAGYVLVDGTVVATSWDDLVDGEIAHEIDLEETGAFHDVMPTHRVAVAVWSSTDVMGHRASAMWDDTGCEDWTVGAVPWSTPAVYGGIGLVYDSSGAQSFLDHRWTDAQNPVGCGALAALYCVEQ